MRHISALIVLVLLAAALPASATVIYDNGAGTISTFADIYPISGTSWVSDSFTISTTANLTYADVALWFPTVDVTVESLDYCISTAITCSVSTDIESATNVHLVPGASVPGSPVGGYNLQEFSFLLSNLTYSAGSTMYWLNLSDAQVDTGVDNVAWDVNYGGSLAGQSTSEGLIPSESFDLISSAIPEPGSMVLMGSGLLALAGILRRRQANR